MNIEDGIIEYKKLKVNSHANEYRLKLGQMSLKIWDTIDLLI